MTPKKMMATGLGIELFGMVGGIATGLPMNGFTLFTWAGAALGLTGVYQWYVQGVDQ